MHCNIKDVTSCIISTVMTKNEQTAGDNVPAPNNLYFEKRDWFLCEKFSSL